MFTKPVLAAVFTAIWLASCQAPAEKSAGRILSEPSTECCPFRNAFWKTNINDEMLLPACSLVSRRNYNAEQVSRKGHRSMRWEIIRIKTCDSTQLGYAIGNWSMTVQVEGHDTTLYGKCVSVWKKQPDGSWKNIQEVNAVRPA